VIELGDGTEPNVLLHNRAIVYRRALHWGDIKEEDIPRDILQEIRRLETMDEAEDKK